MSIQAISTKTNLFTGNNNQVNTPKKTFISNNFDTVSFKAKENKSFLDKLRASVLALPLAVCSPTGNAMVHSDLNSYESPRTSTSQVIHHDNMEEDLTPVDNEFLRAIACLNDTIKPGGPGLMVEFPDVNYTAYLFLDKSGKPNITFEIQNRPKTTLKIDPATGYLQYPSTMNDNLKTYLEKIYQEAIDTFLSSGECDTHIKDMTID